MRPHVTHLKMLERKANVSSYIFLRDKPKEKQIQLLGKRVTKCASKNTKQKNLTKLYSLVRLQGKPKYIMYVPKLTASFGEKNKSSI